MPRLALIAALLAAGWSPLVRCLSTARAAETEPACHQGSTPKSEKAPMSNCAVMACCQAVLLQAEVAVPAPDFVVPAYAAVATLIPVPPTTSAFAPASPPGPPGVLLAVSRLGRAPPVA